MWPGIWLESNTISAPGVAAASVSSGFQVTMLRTSSLLNAATISASEVLTMFTSRSLRPCSSSARASR